MTIGQHQVIELVSKLNKLYKEGKDYSQEFESVWKEIEKVAIECHFLQSSEKVEEIVSNYNLPTKKVFQVVP